MRESIARAAVLLPGVIPLSTIYGIAAGAAGFTWAQAAIMSIFGFAGTAQFAAITVFSSGAGLLAVAGVVFVINSRYLLMTTATLELARPSQPSRWQRIVLSLFVVDESYALQSKWAEDGKPTTSDLLGIGGVLMVVWTAGTIIGVVAGSILPPLETWGLDYALPGLFIGLLGIFAKDREHATVGVACVALGGGLALAGFGTFAAVIVPPVVALAWGNWRSHRVATRDSQPEASP